MIRAVGNKRLDLNDSEFEYYLQIRESFGEQGFRGLFKTDKNGMITAITPPLNKPLDLSILYFIMNVMLNQRLRIMEETFKKMEKNIDEKNSVPNIISRIEKIEKNLGINNDASA